mgnify:CR=1 FL=1
MKTINVSDKAAKFIEKMRQENEYFETKSFICDAIESTVNNIFNHRDIEIIVGQLSDYNQICRYLSDENDIEK